MTLRRWRLVGLVGALGGALGCAAVWLASSAALRPSWYAHRSPEQGLVSREADPFTERVWQGVHRDPEAEFGYAFEDVAFPAVDGSVLRGWYVPGALRARRGLVTVHGAGSDRREFLRHLPFFHEAGYPVLLFDCREHGVSDGSGRGVSFGIREHEDVSAAVAYLKEKRRLSRVAVLGTSQGAASVILAAAADPQIDVVIAENPFTRVSDLIRDTSSSEGAPAPFLELVSSLVLWRLEGAAQLSPIEVVGRIAPRPLLLMHGIDDRVIPYSHSERLRAASGEPTQLWLLPGAGHSALVNLDPRAYQERVVGFLERWLGLPSQPTLAGAAAATSR